MKTTEPVTLRDERLRRHLTIGDVARRAGLSKAAISKIERGEVTRPRPETLVAILTALGITGPVPDAVPVTRHVVALTVRVALEIIARGAATDAATSAA